MNNGNLFPSNRMDSAGFDSNGDFIIPNDLYITRDLYVYRNFIFGNAAADVMTIYGQLHLNDDIYATFGNSAAAPNCKLTWETADANANCLLLTLPTGGATDVPVFVMGDVTAVGVDLTFFNGITNPTFAILSDDKTKYIKFSHTGTNGNLSTGAEAISLGAQTSSHTVNSNGDLICLELEANGKIWADASWQIPNNTYTLATDAAGTGTVNMWKVNASDEMEAGSAVNMGTTEIAEDSGAVSLVNMSVSATPAAATEESYSFLIDSNVILKVYAEADNAGGIQNKEVRLGNDVDLQVKASTGGLNIRTVEATVDVTAAATITIACQAPSGCKFIGCQIRVDAALAGGETWDATYATGATQSIATNQAVAQNTKVNKFFDANDATDIASGATDIAIQRNSNPGVDVFTAQGTFRAIIYYVDFTAMASL